MKIDLYNYQAKRSKVFSGFPEGEQARKSMNLDKLDSINENIEIVIPPETFSLNTSYFLGLFQQSVIKLGKEKFKEKYTFVCKPVIARSIENDIDEALKNTNVLGS